MDFEKIVNHVIRPALKYPMGKDMIDLVKEPSENPIDTILVGNPGDQISGIGQVCMSPMDSCTKSEAVRDTSRHDTSLYSAFS